MKLKSLQSISYKTLFAILFLSLAGIVFFLRIGGKTQKVSAAWWDEMWHYRKAISIENTSGSNQSNVQIKILNNYDLSALVTAGKLQSDLDDLRFTDINGNLLKYWIEDSTNNSADVWGIITSLPASGSTIYMYYGNSSATSISSTSNMTIGGTMTSINGYRIHTFLGNGTLTNANNTTAEVLVVGGGGGGASANGVGDGGGGGGGAGGLVYNASYSLTQGQIINVTVGVGGTNGATSSHQSGSDGGNSVFNTITANGGGGGGTTGINGRAGGSGGGGGYNLYSTVKYGGASVVGIGYSGGNTTDLASASGAGGGGAGGVGGNNITGHVGGNGGSGISYSITGTSVTYASGGRGGGGSGAVNKTANTGNGGDGSYASAVATSGASGIVVVRFLSGSSTLPSSEETSVGAPVAYWKFNEGVGTTVYDSSSYRNNGILVSAPIWKNENECVSEKCLNFNGDDSINLPNDIDYKNTVSAFTWFKSSGAPVGGYHIIFGGQELEISVSIGGVLRTGVYTNTRYVSDHGSGLTDGQWHYVGFTFDGTTKKTYIDGRFVGEQTGIGGTLVSSFSSRTIGKYGSSSSYFLNGYLDEPKIYDYARTADQIKLDYNSRGSISGSSVNLGSNKSVSFPDTGLIGYWDFEENTGTGVKDKSGNNNNGTWSGTDSHWGIGKIGSAGNFSGSDYVNIPSITWTPTMFTVEFWTYPLSRTDYNHAIGASNGWGSFQFHTTATGGIYVGTDGTNRFTPTELPANTLVLNQWQHFTFTFDNGTGKFYKNGTLLASKTGMINPIAWTGFIIGTSSANNINGKIDGVKIYSYARTQKQIIEDMNSSTPITSTKSMTVYYKFDEGNGDNIYNSASTSYNAYKYGAVNWNINGKYDKALLFDGVTSKAVVTNSSSLRNNGNDMSLSVWIKTNPSDNGGHIYSKPWNDSGVYNYWLTSSGGTAPTLTFALEGDSFYSLSTGVPITSNQWHQVTVTVNNTTKEIKIYIDGKLTTSGTHSISGWTPYGGDLNRNLVLGCIYPYDTVFCANNTGFAYGGYIDDFKYYKFVLSDQEILMDYYNQGSAIKFGGNSQNISGTFINQDYCIPGDASYCDLPIAEWKMNEGVGTSVVDTSSNSNNGTIVGATWTTGHKSGESGLSFDGIDDYVWLGYNSLFCPSNITYSAWFKSTLSSGTNLILRNRTYGFTLALVTGGLVDSVIFKNSSTNLYVSSVSSYNDNNWHQVVVTYDGLTARLYMDGVLKSSQTGTSSGPIYCVENAFGIGRDADANASYFTGQIDDVLMYGYARTPEQIAYEYNRSSSSVNQTVNSVTSPLSYCVPGDNSACSAPIAEWNFEENTGTVTKDTSGNNNNGTFGASSSSPAWAAGKTGAGVYFDGGDYISLGNPLGLQLGTRDFTISLDIYRTSFGYQGGSFFDTGSHLNPGIHTYDGYFFVQTTTGELAHVRFQPSYNKWEHHTFVVSQTSTPYIRHYVNGFFDNSGYAASGNLGSINSNYDFKIGVSPAGGINRFFNGKLDNIRIYNYARTPAQITYDYNKGAPVLHWKLDECQGGSVHSSSQLGYCILGDTSTCRNPVAEWKMNENGGNLTYDSSGNIKDLTTYNNTNWAPGKLGSSLEFNGTTNYAKITDSSFNKSNGAEISLSLWIYPTRLGAQYQDLIGNRIDAATFNWLLYQHATDGSIQLHGALQNKSTYIPTLNQWTHIEATVTSSGIYKLYANGQLVQSTTGFQYYPGTPTELHIGNFGSSSEPYQGKIDEVRIYDYARTPDQVIFDYNLGFSPGIYDGVVTIGPSGTQNSLGTCLIGTAAAWVNGASGRNNSSLNFDGTDDYISIPTYTYTTNATISVWVKGSYTNGDQIIIGSPNSISLGLYNVGSTKALIGSAGVSKSVGIAYNFINNSWNH
ncbi:MAG: DUF2341 domain-containing protein, partial [Candidatus Shapirobacteria bacterium]|nr:DUF2341 domain-containing protein [Candidatus Shapirobacteria bacterium]